MTLQNLRYIVEVANCRSFSKAAKTLYMSQSALSAAVKDLEEELGIRIFLRSNRGVTLTPEGEDCLKYCKEIIARADYLSLRYQKRDTVRTYFSVSAQHLPFAVRAFRELLDRAAPSAYDAAIRETNTSDILHDVSTVKSELGIVAFQPEQLELIQKSLYVHDLAFTELSRLSTYVFLRRQHPLASRAALSLEDLRDYPFVTYDQEDAPSYYTEETLFFKPLQRIIHVCDRATKMAIIRSSDAFSIGLDLPNFNKDIYFKNSTTELVAVPFDDQQGKLIVGYLAKAGHPLSELAMAYLQLLTEHMQKLVLPKAGIV